MCLVLNAIGLERSEDASPIGASGRDSNSIGVSLTDISRQIRIARWLLMRCAHAHFRRSGSASSGEWLEFVNGLYRNSRTVDILMQLVMPFRRPSLSTDNEESTRKMHVQSAHSALLKRPQIDYARTNFVRFYLPLTWSDVHLSYNQAGAWNVLHRWELPFYNWN